MTTTQQCGSEGSELMSLTGSERNNQDLCNFDQMLIASLGILIVSRPRGRAVQNLRPYRPEEEYASNRFNGTWFRSARVMKKQAGKRGKTMMQSRRERGSRTTP